MKDSHFLLKNIINVYYISYNVRQKIDETIIDLTCIIITLLK